MGKVVKLHRRLVKKRKEIKVHKQAVRALLGIIATYANHGNWKITDDTRDIMEGGIVIGVQTLMKWIGPGIGPELAETIIKGVK